MLIHTLPRLHNMQKHDPQILTTLSYHLQERNTGRENEREKYYERIPMRPNTQLQRWKQPIHTVEGITDDCTYTQSTFHASTTILLVEKWDLGIRFLNLTDLGCCRYSPSIICSWSEEERLTEKMITSDLDLDRYQSKTHWQSISLDPHEAATQNVQLAQTAEAHTSVQMLAACVSEMATWTHLSTREVNYDVFLFHDDMCHACSQARPRPQRL